MRFFSLLVVLVISVNLSAQSEEAKAPATITKLNDEIKSKLCVLLKDYFEKEAYPLVIAVGEFTSPPDDDTNYSNGFKKTITDELKNIGFKVEKSATFFLNGEYFKSSSKDDKEISVKGSFELKNKTTKEKISVFPIQINYFVDVAKIIGSTVAFTADSPPVPPGDVKREKESRNQYPETTLQDAKDINRKIAENSVTPKFYLNKDSDLIRTKQSASYGIKIWVKDGEKFRYIPIRENDEKRPFVDLKKGDIYKIELINDSKYEAAAEVLIDGLNTHNFSEIRDPNTKSHKYKYIIIDSDGKSVVHGWEKNDNKVYEFKTDIYAEDNQQSNFKPVQETGIIMVSFYVSYEKGKKPPFISATKGPRKLQTVRGKEVDSKTSSVEREVSDQPIDIISIRYSH